MAPVGLVLVVLAVVFLVLGFVGTIGLALAVGIAVACVLAALILNRGGLRL